MIEGSAAQRETRDAKKTTGTTIHTTPSPPAMIEYREEEIGDKISKIQGER